MRPNRRAEALGVGFAFAIAVGGCLAPTDPSPSGSVPPTSTTLSGGSIVVAIPSQAGDRHLFQVTIEHDGILVAARPATEAEMNRANMGERDIVLANVTERRLLLIWIGSVCERFATLTVERQRVVLAPAPRHGCDALAFGWGLVLTTTEPWDAAAVEATQLPTTLLP